MIFFTVFFCLLLTVVVGIDLQGNGKRNDFANLHSNVFGFFFLIAVELWEIDNSRTAMGIWSHQIFSLLTEVRVFISNWNTKFIQSYIGCYINQNEPAHREWGVSKNI